MYLIILLIIIYIAFILPPASSQFYGERWVAYDSQLGDLDYAVMPIYDVNGYIAGLQAAVSLSNIIQN